MKPTPFTIEGLMSENDTIFDYAAPADRHGIPSRSYTFYGSALLHGKLWEEWDDLNDPDVEFAYELTFTDGKSKKDQTVYKADGFESAEDAMRDAFEEALHRAKRDGFVLAPQESHFPSAFLKGRETYKATVQRKKQYDATGRFASTLRSKVIRLASEIPVGDPIRVKILRALKDT